MAKTTNRVIAITRMFYAANFFLSVNGIGSQHLNSVTKISSCNFIPYTIHLHLLQSTLHRRKPLNYIPIILFIDPSYQPMHWCGPQILVRFAISTCDALERNINNICPQHPSTEWLGIVCHRSCWKKFAHNDSWQESIALVRIYVPAHVNRSLP